MVVVVVIAAAEVSVDKEMIPPRHARDGQAQDCGIRGVATAHPENIRNVQSRSKLLEMPYVFSLCAELSSLSYLQHSSGTPCSQ
jgi:hypothetical protein